MNDTIRLQGLRAYGYHGVLASEARDGQQFVVDVEMTIDMELAAAQDDLATTVDYGTVARLVVDTVRSTRFQLIEALADEIARRVRSDSRVIAVAVTVHKPQAPIDVEFDDVLVTRRLP